MGAVRLVLRADDGGGCVSANEAVYEGIVAGTIRNASLMACGSEFDAMAEMLRGRTDVCLGLHVTLNAEWDTVKWGPVLPPEQVPSLLDPGTTNFTATPKILHEKGFVVAEAVTEVVAQLARARNAGLTITYLDEHMGVGWITGEGGNLGDALREFSQREGLLYVRDLQLGGLPRVSIPQQETAQYRDTADELIGYWLAALGASASGTHLLVTHPGRTAPDMEQFIHAGLTPGQVAAERDAERRALADPKLRAGLENLGVTLCRYDEV